MNPAWDCVSTVTGFMVSNANHAASPPRVSFRDISRPPRPAAVPPIWSQEVSDQRPGTGAERTRTSRLAGMFGWNASYQPRHRSPRRDYTETGWLTLQALEDPPPDQYCGPAWPDLSAEEPWANDDSEESDFLQQLTGGQVRRMLESSAINGDLTEAVPDLVQAVAHSSHTTATLSSAWRDFQVAVRDAYALHLSKRAWWEFFSRQDLGSCPQEMAVEIKLGDADDAWCLIVNGWY
jgi:hypothetical protein